MTMKQTARRTKHRNQRPFGDSAWLMQPVAAAVLWLGFWAYAEPKWALFFAVLSVWLYVLYGWDKRAAQNGRRRISEKQLHLTALFGGWPGAWLARRQFRHKTSKQPFIRLFWLCVLLNIAVTIGLYLYAQGGIKL